MRKRHQYIAALNERLRRHKSRATKRWENEKAAYQPIYEAWYQTRTAYLEAALKPETVLLGMTAMLKKHCEFDPYAFFAEIHNLGFELPPTPGPMPRRPLVPPPTDRPYTAKGWYPRIRFGRRLRIIGGI